MIRSTTIQDHFLSLLVTLAIIPTRLPKDQRVDVFLLSTKDRSFLIMIKGWIRGHLASCVSYCCHCSPRPLQVILFIIYRESQEMHFLLEPQCIGSTTICRHPLCLEIFGHFSLRLSMIKRPQVMSMIKFGPTALNSIRIKRRTWVRYKL